MEYFDLFDGTCGSDAEMVCRVAGIRLTRTAVDEIRSLGLTFDACDWSQAHVTDLANDGSLVCAA